MSGALYAIAGVISSSVPLPKFVIHRGTPRHELRKQRGTSKPMIPVSHFDLKFLNELAASGTGTSNRRHWASEISRVDPEEGRRHARVTKASTTRFSPALSNCTTSLLPSTMETCP